MPRRVIQTIPRGLTELGTCIWHEGDRCYLSAIVKGAFILEPGRDAVPAAPDALVEKDTHVDRDPRRPIEDASELAPAKPCAELIVHATAFAPSTGPVPAVSTRVTVAGKTRLIDKTLHVYGERRAPNDPPQPFRRMPIDYERAPGGPDTHNPFGVRRDEERQPNVVPLGGASGVAGFGPIVGRRIEGQALPRRRSKSHFGTWMIPPDVDWTRFLRSPLDQRCDYLNGDEWIVLDGLHPTLAHLDSRLPNVSAQAKLIRFVAGERQEIGSFPLQLDTLVARPERLLVEVFWRGALELPPLGEDTALLDEQGIPVEGLAVDGAVLVHGAITKSAIDVESTVVLDSPEADSTMVLDTPEAHASFNLDTTMDVPDLDALPPSDPLPFSQPPPPPSVPVVVFPSPPSSSRLELQPPSSPLITQPAPWPADANVEETIALTGSEVPPPPPSEPPAAAEDGERRSENIPVVTRTPCTFATLAWQVDPPQDSLTVVVKATFDIVPDKPARLRDEGDFPTGELPFDDDPERSLRAGGDVAYLKPRADVTLVGHAYPPSSSDRPTAVQTELRFGEGSRGFVRRIAVFGDRHWTGGALELGISELEPFEKVPLTYENAFGGPKYGDNPVGCGHPSAKPSRGARLPNLEDPAHLIRGPGDRPAPACYGPIAMQWTPRWSKLGTYDRKWFKTRWPYYPEDFDWAFYQSAPESQQLDALQGDETFSLTGMHPEHPRIDGSLPSLAARCAYQETAAAGGRFQEVTLRLDTAAFDVDEMKLCLVWRGLLNVSDEDAPEILRFFVDLEPLEDRSSLETLHARYLAALAPPEEAEPDADPEEPSEEAEALQDEVDEGQAELHAKLRDLGVDPDANLEADAVPPPPMPDAELESMLNAAGASPEDVAELKAARSPEAEGVEPEADVEPEDLRARVVAMLHEEQSFERMDLAGADLSGLDFSGRSLVETNLKDANLEGASFAEADLTMAQLSKAHARRAVFDGAKLVDADATEADLAEASFVAADLGGATLASAQAGAAVFREARGAGPQLAGAQLAGAIFDDAELESADFTGANLAGASFKRAHMSSIRLYDCIADGADFDDSVMTGIRAEGVRAEAGRFNRADLSEGVFEWGLLDGASFMDAKLGDASFVRAHCNRAVFSKADLKDARFKRAKLRGASFLEANLLMANLERADLTEADFRGANLHGSETWKAKTSGIQLDLALATQSKLGKLQ